MKIKLIAALLSTLAALNVNAATTVGELGVGITHASAQPNMTWWQNCEHDGCPYKLRMNSPALSLGVKTTLDHKWLGFDKWYVRAGATYDGRFTSSAVATASDYNYGTCRYVQAECWPMSHWYGTGDIKGLYLTIMPEINMGTYKILFEGGIKPYWATWKVDIPDWRPTREGPVQSLTAKHKARWEYSYILGAGIKINDITIMYNQWLANATGDEFPAIYSGTAKTLSIRFDF